MTGEGRKWGWYEGGGLERARSFRYSRAAALTFSRRRMSFLNALLDSSIP